MREAARQQTTTVSGRGKEGRREEGGREGGKEGRKREGGREGGKRGREGREGRREGGKRKEGGRGREGGKEGRGREGGKRVGATPTGISALRIAVEVLPRHPGM